MKSYLCLVAPFLATTPLFAQSSQSGSTPDVSLELQAWQAEHGTTWHAREDRKTGFVEMLFGGSAPSGSVPDTSEPAAWFQLTRDWVDSTQSMHGTNSSELADGRFVYLPLGMAKGTDKVSVSMYQEVDGIRVENARVNALYDTRGTLLSLHNTTAPYADQVDTTPALSQADALERSMGWFAETEGIEANSTDVPELMIAQFERDGFRSARLAWQVRVLWRMDGAQDRGFIYTVDAITGQRLRRDEAVHNFDVTGQVQTLATPGVAADSNNNPEQALEASHIRVTAPGQNPVFADRFGNFTFPGVNTPLDITVTYRSPFVTVDNDTGANYSETFTNVQPNTANTLVLNPNALAAVTAQANAFLHINTVRDYIRDIVPTDSTADFVAPANVNIAAACNAFWSGGSTNYFQAGSGCNNTAFSTVVAHEQGHWLNALYGTGNGPDGMGEGNADVFGLYIFDTPNLGLAFFASGATLRSGNNTRQYCGDGNGGCHGGVHNNGEVWMGAAWKVRTRLKASLGDTLGSATADSLFMSWMNSFNQSTIDSIIEIQWLTLDDDDGNIDNGTPNYNDIDGGFLQQGFPGFELLLVDIVDVDQLPDVASDVGPYTVNASISALYNPPIQSADLHWRINGGAFTTVPMTSMGGDDYAGVIPAQLGLGAIEYFISATDNTGEGNSFPREGDEGPLFFDAGAVTIESWDFESGPSGWTVADPSTATDGIWVTGDPIGTDAQPEDDHTLNGTDCWFTGQGVVGGGPNMDDIDDGTTTLYSPIFDASGLNLPSISYWRWYSNDEGNNPNTDFMPIDISNDGGVTWELLERPGGAEDEASGGWFQNRQPIADFVTPTSQMQIRFRARDLGNPSAVEAAVDDVRFYHYDDSEIGTRYCSPALANSTGLPSVLSITGSDVVADNAMVLNASQLPNDQFGFFLTSMTQGFVANAGGSQGNLCLGGDIGRYNLASQLRDSGAGGQYSLAIDLTQTPAAAGLVTIQAGETWNFQSWHRDFLPGQGATSNFTDAVSVLFQ